MTCAEGHACCNGGEYCKCKKEERTGSGELLVQNRPTIYSTPLPPWPTIGEIRLAIRDELRKAGVI
jgi:hypothetical protein